MSTRVRAAVIATLAVLPMIAATPAAFAHAGLLGTTPAADAVVTASPPQVVLSFDEAVLDQGAGILVTDAAGNHYETAGTLTYGGAKISIELKPLGDPGTYTVAWRVVADDGDPQSQTYTFDYQPAGSATTPAATSSASDPSASSAAGGTSDSSGGTPWLPFAIVGFVIIVAVAVVLVVRSGRESGDRTTQ